MNSEKGRNSVKCPELVAVTKICCVWFSPLYVFRILLSQPPLSPHASLLHFLFWSLFICLSTQSLLHYKSVQCSTLLCSISLFSPHSSQDALILWMFAGFRSLSCASLVWFVDTLVFISDFITFNVNAVCKTFLQFTFNLQLPSLIKSLFKSFFFI